MITINSVFKYIDNKNLSELQINKREKDWEVIQSYWEVNKYDLLEKYLRVKKFEEISKAKGLSVQKIKKLFSRYWQRGMNKNALLPDYINSGAKGKERKLTENKVGRPKRADYYGEVIEGINITTEVKQHFQISINKYYRNSN